MTNDDRRECVLRTLTLCDGEVAHTAPPRARPTGCYCNRLEAAGDDVQRRREALTELCRAVAASEGLSRIVAARRARDAW